ncbi:MAG: hypothetical protein LBN23_05135 [Paludibacter sp.]|nr:hypothetical protein [Paludibacter sp.]
MLDGKKFSFPFDDKDIPINNGIYILYQKGELWHNGDRIVRIGTDTGENQLRSRMEQHFIKQNKNRSIFRKNIGRALLNKENNPYLEIWNLDTTSKADKEKNGSKIDKTLEQSVENKISKYLQENFYFKLLKIDTKEKRLELEEKLIGTVSNCKECKPSETWLGNFSPKEKIRESGLWLEQGLYKDGLSENELDEIKNSLLKSE